VSLALEQAWSLEHSHLDEPLVRFGREPNTWESLSEFGSRQGLPIDQYVKIYGHKQEGEEVNCL